MKPKAKTAAMAVKDIEEAIRNRGSDTGLGSTTTREMGNAAGRAWGRSRSRSNSPPWRRRWGGGGRSPAAPLLSF